MQLGVVWCMTSLAATIVPKADAAQRGDDANSSPREERTTTLQHKVSASFGNRFSVACSREQAIRARHFRDHRCSVAHKNEVNVGVWLNPEHNDLRPYSPGMSFDAVVRVLGVSRGGTRSPMALTVVALGWRSTRRRCGSLSVLSGQSS
jgi:hypothetical protein